MDAHLIDNLQYANWSEKIFRQMRKGGVDAVHVTIAYHESFREMVLNLEQWNRWFEQYPNLVFKATCGDDVRKAKTQNARQSFSGSRIRHRLKMTSALLKSATALASASCS